MVSEDESDSTSCSSSSSTSSEAELKFIYQSVGYSDNVSELLLNVAIAKQTILSYRDFGSQSWLLHDSGIRQALSWFSSPSAVVEVEVSGDGGEEVWTGGRNLMLKRRCA